ncbi:MAG: sulfotransferase domain-containing protein [Promethearchaeota archaeon]|jgi:hypothetical protein
MRLKKIRYTFQKTINTSLIFSKLYIDRNQDYRKTLFVAGTGRSGTTWVANILNYNGDYRFMFEPFTPRYVQECMNFKYRQYIRPDNKDSKFLNPAKEILSGSIRNKWIDRFNKKLLCDYRLIKDIRANLFLKWIKTNFPEIPIILVLRHPCAVANSRLKLKWDNHLDILLAQQELIDDFLMDFISEIGNCKTNFEKHVFLWCIENYIPLKQFRKGEVHIVFYENMCVNPLKEINRLFRFIGRKYTHKVFRQTKKPVMIRTDSAVLTGDELISSWKRNVRKKMIKRTIDILELFELNKIYTEKPEPNSDKIL